MSWDEAFPLCTKVIFPCAVVNYKRAFWPSAKVGITGDLKEDGLAGPIESQIEVRV